jgi:hypothetical protein
LLEWESQAELLGIVIAPDSKAAKAAAVQKFNLKPGIAGNSYDG